MDAAEKRAVDFNDALSLAKQYGLAGAVETSAKEGSQSLYDAFFLVTANALDHQKSKDIGGLSQVPSDLRRPRF